jgi:hypothetical protein
VGRVGRFGARISSTSWRDYWAARPYRREHRVVVPTFCPHFRRITVYQDLTTVMSSRS